ncbi:MAG: Ribose operon repressor [Anaerolineales bacterium]|nr:Ribose operon repressor [Anaerolineales bacterium]
MPWHEIEDFSLRKALDAAERDGLLYRVAGKGTFVEADPAAEARRLVGFVIPQFRSSFDNNLLIGVERTLKKRDYCVLFCNSERRLEEENDLLAALMRDRVDGVIIWPVQSDDLDRELFRLSMRNFPLVLMDRTFPYLEADCALADNRGGAYAATKHLIELGHRKIAFLARPYLHLLPLAERLAGYRQALRDAGLEPLPPLLVGEALEPGTGYALRAYANATGPDIDALREVLAEPDRPTAIFAMNDLMALLVMKAATLNDLMIPDDLSVIGFDDLDVVSQLHVPLTTVAQNPLDLGKTAAQLLLDRFNGYHDAPRQRRLPTELRVRETSGPPST